MAFEELRAEREKKLRRYEEGGRGAYPASVRRDFSIGAFRKKFPALERSKKKAALSGRIRAIRSHGGIAFADLEDSSGKVQLQFSEEILEEQYARVLGAMDIGDFWEAEGRAAKTKRGELSLDVSAARMISKSMRPLPEKWHGLKDVEERFRKRYVDLVMNEEVRARFLKRSEAIREIRNFFDGEEFVEVETPVLQNVPGGALAEPFRTHHNALDLDLYLRIAPELYLKRLLVGGFERVYEIGRSFRNEGIDVSHNPEFTMLEWYAAYWDEEQMMEFTEHLFLHLFKRMDMGSRFSYAGKKIEIPKTFPNVSFQDVLKRYALIVDYEKETRESLAGRARQFGIEAKPNESKGKIADEIYKKVCRPHLQNPVFVTSHPVDISPLAKKNEARPGTVRRFQLVIAGLELANAYAELNDPREQRLRFEEQARLRAAGDAESHRIDEDYIEALEYGMPPAAGAGVGIDRLVMLLTDAQNIREAVLFPTLKPK